MKFWLSIFLALFFCVSVVSASEPAYDTLPPELVRLRDEGRLTVRALWAWNLVPKSTAGMALEFRAMGLDLIEADGELLGQWARQADAGELSLTPEQRGVLDELLVWMNSGLEARPDQPDTGTEAQNAQAAEPAPPTDASVADGLAAEVPATDVPVADGLAAEVPATDVPVADGLAAEVPAPDVPAADGLAAEVPATDVPAADGLAAEVPATDVPVADGLAAEVPATDAPLADGLAAEAPAPDGQIVAEALPQEGSQIPDQALPDPASIDGAEAGAAVEAEPAPPLAEPATISRPWRAKALRPCTGVVRSGPGSRPGRFRQANRPSSGSVS
jgi:hypothetical protein